MVDYDECLSSCILASVDRKKTRKVLNVPERLDVALFVSLSYPAKNPVVETVSNGNIKYWLNKIRVIQVPKRDSKHIVGWNSC